MIANEGIAKQFQKMALMGMLGMKVSFKSSFKKVVKQGFNPCEFAGVGLKVVEFHHFEMQFNHLEFEVIKLFQMGQLERF